MSHIQKMRHVWFKQIVWFVLSTLIYRIGIYPVDSVIQPWRMGPRWGSPTYFVGLKIGMLGICLGLKKMCNFWINLQANFILSSGSEKYRHSIKPLVSNHNVEERSMLIMSTRGPVYKQMWSRREDKETLTDIPILLVYWSCFLSLVTLPVWKCDF